MIRWSRQDVAAIGLLLAWVLVVGLPTLELYWTHDDPFLLRWSDEHTVLQAFVDRESARELPFGLVTPWLFASFELDLALFGRRPAFFRAHQLLALGLATVLLYGVLRLWLRPLWAGFAGGVFLLGPATVAWFQQLMTRHYVEGLAWSAAATLGFVWALRRDRWAGQIPASAATALAMCAKEVYVPLPLLFALLPEGTVRQRLRHLAPHLVILGAYPIWRRALLGAWVGGYGWVSGPAEWVSLPGKLGREMVGAAPGWGLSALLVLGVLALRGAWVHPSGRRLGAAALVLTLAPLIPVASSPEPRVAVLPWGVLAVAAAFGLRSVPWGRSPAWAGAGVIVLLLVLLPAHRATWSAEYAEMRRMSGEARSFHEDLDASDLLAWPATPRGTLSELARHRRSRGLSAAGWFADSLYLCLHDPLSQRVMTWRDAEGSVVDVTGEVPDLRDELCGSVRWQAPLRVELTPDPEDRTLAWRLGPWREGRWFLVTGGGRNRYEVPREAAFFVGDSADVRLRVRYDHPAGWTTYSSEFSVSFEPGRDAPEVWER